LLITIPFGPIVRIPLRVDRMSRIFLSHSSKDNFEAIALRDWLASEGWKDVFLDLDPERGIAAGQRWERALHDAARQCEAVIFLVSANWLGSGWCTKEYALARGLNKKLFGTLTDPAGTIGSLPEELTGVWQAVDLVHGDDLRLFPVRPPGAYEERHIGYSESGLIRLKRGLEKAGLDPRFFPWPPIKEPDRAPYRGLKPPEADDAGIFFGRDAPIVDAIDRLRGLRTEAPPRLMAILGASGAGKSSFLRAGLLPRLNRDDAQFIALPVVRPGRAALTGETGLVNALAAILPERTRAELRATVQAGTGALRPLLAALVQAVAARRVAGDESERPPAFVFAIDQAEELFRAEGREESETLLALLADLAAGDDPTAIVIFTIRSDSYDALQRAKALEGLRQVAFSLLPMPRGAYSDVIEGPARRVEEAGGKLAVEPALTQRLLVDVEAGAGDALPLLAFTLEQLYLDYRQSGALRFVDYEKFGGIKGAIDAAVERALARADADPRIPRDREARLALLRRGMIPWLAGVDPDSKTPRRNIARRSDIPPEAAPLIDFLVEERLLSVDTRVARDSKTGEETRESTIEPTHEALLRQWGLFDGWLTEDFGLLATLEGVKRGARDWDANSRGDSWLAHQGQRLTEALALDARPDIAGRLDATDRAYLAGCRLRDETARAEAEQRLHEREQEQARKLADARKIAFRTAVGAVVAILFAIVAGALGYYGLSEKTLADQKAAEAITRTAEAVTQKNKADAATKDAASRELAAEARVNFDTRAPHDILLALKSISMTRQDSVFGPVASRQLLEDVLTETGGIPFRHDAEITAVEFSPDDRWLATASADAVRLWDTQAPFAAPKLFHGPSKINAIAFSPDGKTLATVGDDASVRLWDITSFAHSDRVRELNGRGARWLNVGFSRDGRWLAASNADGGVRLWRWPDPASTPLILAHGTEGVLALAFSPDSKWLATGSADKSVRMWNLLNEDPASNPKLLRSGRGWDIKLVFSPDSQWLAAGGSGGGRDPLMLWKVAAPDRAFVLNGVSWTGVLAFSPDGRWLVTPGDRFDSRGQYGTRLVWDLTKSDPSADPVTLPGHNRLSDLAFSPDGTWLATGSEDFTTQLWNVSDSFAPPIVLQGHEGAISRVAFSHDGRRVATASKDQTVRLWTASSPTAEPLEMRISDGSTRRLSLWDLSGAELPSAPRTLNNERVSLQAATTFSPDGNWIAVTPYIEGNDVVHVFSKLSNAHYIIHDRGGILAAPVFSPDGHWLITAGNRDPTIKLWDLLASDPTSAPRLLRGHTTPIRSLAISADGRRLISGARGTNDTAIVWDLTAPDPSINRVTLTAGDVRAVAISADGRYVVTGSWEPDFDARIWDLSTQPSFKSPIRLTFKNRVFDVAISPDGRWVAAGSWDSTTQLLDLTQRNADPTTLRGHTARTLSVAFSQDSQWLATGNEDKTVRLWNLSDPRHLRDASAGSVVLHTPYGVGNVSFSLDGRWLALESTEFRTNPFSPDAHWFASTNADTLIYRLQLEDLISLACRTAGPDLTEGEGAQYGGNCLVPSGSGAARKVQ
jgi:WD40 repeat protein